MRLEAPNCIQEWKHRLGPWNPKEWTKTSDFLRAKFRAEGDKSGFYGSPNDISAKKELKFFFACKLKYICQCILMMYRQCHLGC